MLQAQSDIHNESWEGGADIGKVPVITVLFCLNTKIKKELLNTGSTGSPEESQSLKARESPELLCWPQSEPCFE